MAKTIINLSDTLSTFVDKSNAISNTVGDLAALNTTEDSDIVGAINSVYALVDSSTDFRSKFTADKGLVYNSATGNFDVDSANLRGIVSGNKGISYNSSTGVIDVDSANLRGIVSVVDAGGDGSLTYDSALGKFTYTGPSASEVRAHLAPGEGIDYDSASGTISGEDASTSNKGIAKFASADFSVSSGDVSLVDIVSSHFGSPVTLTIYDSAGSTLKTIRSPGS